MDDVKVEIVPISTRILTEKDDIVDVVERYAGKLITENDVISVAESVVAITQGMCVRPEDLKISLLARVGCRFFPDYGSLATPHGLQALIETSGQIRVFCALIIGFIGKLMGKKGLFYIYGGEQAALIDDVTGTMPPFDKHAVYGPVKANDVCNRLKERLGCFGGLIADVNDLKRSRVVGSSDGLNAPEAAKMLIDNPFGNASEKRPICIIKNFRQYQESLQK